MKRIQQINSRTNYFSLQNKKPVLSITQFNLKSSIKSLTETQSKFFNKIKQNSLSNKKLSPKISPINKPQITNKFPFLFDKKLNRVQIKFQHQSHNHQPEFNYKRQLQNKLQVKKKYSQPDFQPKKSYSKLLEPINKGELIKKDKHYLHINNLLSSQIKSVKRSQSDNLIKKKLQSIQRKYKQNYKKKLMSLPKVPLDNQSKYDKSRKQSIYEKKFSQKQQFIIRQQSFRIKLGKNDEQICVIGWQNIEEQDKQG